MTVQVSSAEITDEVEAAEADWRYPIVKYLRDPYGNHERTVARCYLIYQNELYRKGSYGLLLLCPSAEDINVIMAESHKGICGAHQSGVKMRWLVWRHGYYWPTILKNYIEYAKGCIKCQIYGPIQRVPADALHPVTNGCSEDGPRISSAKSTQPHPTSTPGFWWQLTISLNGSRRSPIGPFLANRWSDSSKITSSTDSVYPKPSAETREYAERVGIKLVHSTPYYPQSNGQAEASNEVIKGILEKMIEEKPRAWHDLLPEALWAY
ncbi:unnamed protein product [Prunus armeniaca]